jgi:hypothetical protein
MVSGAIMITISTLWITYMKNSLRDETSLQIKGEVRQLENMLNEFLLNPDAVVRNVGEAFRGIDVRIGPQHGQLDVLESAPIKRGESGWFRGKPLVKLQSPYGSRNVHVERIDVSLEDIRQNEDPELDWKYVANMKIEIEILFCPDGGSLYRYGGDPPRPVSEELCSNPRSRLVKRFGELGYNVDDNGYIEELPYN